MEFEHLNPAVAEKAKARFDDLALVAPATLAELNRFQQLVLHHWSTKPPDGGIDLAKEGLDAAIAKYKELLIDSGEIDSKVAVLKARPEITDLNSLEKYRVKLKKHISENYPQATVKLQLTALEAAVRIYRAELAAQLGSQEKAKSFGLWPKFREYQQGREKQTIPENSTEEKRFFDVFHQELEANGWTDPDVFQLFRATYDLIIDVTKSRPAFRRAEKTLQKIQSLSDISVTGVSETRILYLRAKAIYERKRLEKEDYIRQKMSEDIVEAFPLGEKQDQVRSFINNLNYLHTLLKGLRKKGVSIHNISKDQRTVVQDAYSKLLSNSVVLVEIDLNFDIESDLQAEMMELYHETMSEAQIMLGQYTDNLFADNQDIQFWILFSPDDFHTKVLELEALWQQFLAKNVLVEPLYLQHLKKLLRFMIAKQKQIIQTDQSDPSYPDRFLYLDIQINRLQEMLEEAEQALESESQHDSDDHHEHFEGHKYPYMQKYDMSKRFFLSSEVAEGWGYTYAEVKNWSREHIIHALYLYIFDKISRNLPPTQPFDGMEFLKMHVEVTTPHGDTTDFSVLNVIQDLGGKTSENLMYRIGAMTKVMSVAAAKQPLRTENGTHTKTVKDGTVESFHIESVIKIADAGTELRARGVPIPNAIILRRLVRLALNRNLISNLKWQEQMADGSTVERSYANTHPKPLAHEPDPGRPKLVQAQADFTSIIVEEIEKAYADFTDWDEDELPAQIDKFRDEIDTTANAMTRFLISFLDMPLVSARIIFDTGASRYDDLQGAWRYRTRAAQEKYFERDGSGQVIKRQGGTKLPREILPFFERMWIPAILRYRFRVPYLYVENGEVQLGVAHRSWHDLYLDTNIPDRAPITVDQAKDLIDKQKRHQKDPTKPSVTVAELTALGLTIPAEQDPSGKTRIPSQRGIYLTSFEEVVKTGLPADIPQHEARIIDHVETVEKVLFGDWDFDPANIVVTKELDGGRKIAGANQKEADKIAGMLRGAWYYWIQDYKVYTYKSEAEYNEHRENYSPPTQRSGESDEDFEYRYSIWKTEWSHRGIPIRTVKRDSDGTPITGPDGEYQVEYSEYMIGGLYNFHLDQVLNGLQQEGEMSKGMRNHFMSDFARITGEPGDGDQLSEMMRVMMEKAIIKKLIAHKDARKEWDHRYTDAFIEILSSEAYYANREGLRGLLLRRKEGWQGLTGKAGAYDLVGGWSKKEVINMLKTVFDDGSLWRAPKKS